MAAPKANTQPDPKNAFGLIDYTMLPKLNRILKPYGLKLSTRSIPSQWGDQVEIKITELRKAGASGNHR